MCMRHENRRLDEMRSVPAVTPNLPAGRSSASEIDAFLRQAAGAPKPSGSLIFSLDATLSRQPTWDRACHLQSEMFDVVGSRGLAVQLVYFRGLCECRASRWVTGAEDLRRLMAGIDCKGGATQVRKVLKHAASAAAERGIGALVFVGDAFEEDIDMACRQAGDLGRVGLPCFMFQEGRDAAAARAFRAIAEFSGGAYLRLDEAAADTLRNLLRAVAGFAAGGLRALEHQGSREGLLLLEQLATNGRRAGR